MRRNSDELIHTLYQTTRDLVQATDRTEICEATVKSAQAILDIPVVGVHLDDGDGRLVPVAMSEAAKDRVDGEIPAYETGTDDYKHRLVWGAYRAGETYRFAEDDDNEIVTDGLFVPIGDYGILLAFPPRGRTFSETVIKTVEILATTTEESLKRLDRESSLREKNDRLEEFARLVSHDLRNPLNVAIGHLNAARDEHDSEYLDRVAQSHDRMATLIDDFLDLARSGTPVEDADAVRLGAIAEESWATVETADATLAVETTRVIHADRSRLKQLFENLFRNAVEHGGDDVTVTVGDLPAGDGFYIADDGPGIPSENREKVLESGYSTTDQGTGLGLGIVHEITKAHGWTLDITESAEGGARFEITGVARGESDRELGE